MPRGHKSKLRAREKRHQAQDEPQGLKDAQATAADDGDAVPSTSTVAASSTAAAQVPCRKSGKGAKSRGEERVSSSGNPPSAEKPRRDLVMRKAGMLMEYMLNKYKMKEPILRGEMLKMINKRFREQFPEMLKRASDRLELVFGLELREIKPGGNSFTVVSQLQFRNDGSQNSELGFPTTGLLIPLLGVIYINGNRASEEEIWEFLNTLGVYDGIKHFIFGDPRKLITQDLVQENYLEYRQVANSDPPRYEFLWGPKAHVETSKIKVLEFLAKVNNDIPRALPSRYEEALREEEEKAQGEVAARRGTTAKAKARSKGKSRKSNH